MVDINVISERLKQLSLRTAKVRALCPAGLEGLTGDALDLVSFNLFLAVQICVDLATHLISDESWEPAATNREAFERLEEHGVISHETVRVLARRSRPARRTLQPWPGPAPRRRRHRPEAG